MNAKQRSTSVCSKCQRRTKTYPSARGNLCDRCLADESVESTFLVSISLPRRYLREHDIAETQMDISSFIEEAVGGIVPDDAKISVNVTDIRAGSYILSVSAADIFKLYPKLSPVIAKKTIEYIDEKLDKHTLIKKTVEHFSAAADERIAPEAPANRRFGSLSGLFRGITQRYSL